jgi:hypothetical protein
MQEVSVSTHKMTKIFGHRHETRLSALIIVVLFMSACATQAFVATPVDPSGFSQRGISQDQQSVRVTAAVPGAEETIELFAADLYSENIQPVWLKVENRRESSVRIIHSSIDADYFSPLEVAWLYRKNFKKSNRNAYDSWFIENTLPRYVAPGETRSGFVFTHATKGTKGFNLDIYGDVHAISFTFFVPLTGFRPDYMDVDFEGLYDSDEVFEGDLSDLRHRLHDLTCCTLNESGEKSGGPLNAVIVGTPEAVRRALLRGGWRESEANSQDNALARLHYFQERPPDGTFHKTRQGGREHKELRLWLAPMLIDGETVWLGHVSSIMNDTTSIRDVEEYHVDPDTDDARMFLLQNFWYNQSLRSFAMVDGVPAATILAPHEDFHGSQYFTDGFRVVLMLSEDPVAMRETQILNWEKSVVE